MSSSEDLRRCSAKTKAGQPCRAWAIRGTDRCAAHSGRVGAPKGNQNRLTHGWYKKSTKPVITIEDAIENLGEQLAHSTDMLAQTDDPEVWLRVFALHAQAMSRQGRLLREKKAITGKSADDVLDAISVVLDLINEEKGTEL